VFQRKAPDHSLLNVAESIRQKGNCDVIITNGSQPVRALLKAGGEVTLRPPRIPVIDTTGAGDIFKAGLLYGLWKRLSMRQSLKWAVAAAAAKAGRAGTTADPATLSSVQKLVSKVSEKA
jgi:sugar/nucleoside kinase (ribokinase family)